MLIIGIAGGTGSGKTTVVRKIIESLPAGNQSAIVLFNEKPTFVKTILTDAQALEDDDTESDAIEFSRVFAIRFGKSIFLPRGIIVRKIR